MLDTAVISTVMCSLAMVVSDILRGTASRQRVSPAELAQKTGYHKSKINRLLSGKTPIGIDDADKLSHALGVDLDEIIREAMAEIPDRPRTMSTSEERLRRI